MVQIAIDPNKLTGYQTFDGWVKTRPPVLPTGLSGKMAQEARYLTLINQILAEQRLIAWDHEHHLHHGKGETWQGAALIRATNGRYFLSSNAHLPNSLAVRNCAETLAATDGYNHLADNFDIAEIYFMGGRADISRGIAILPGEENKRYTPCGHCRDIIHRWRRRDGRKTKVTLFPLNDGTQTILPYDGKKLDQLARNQAFTLPIDELLPQLEWIRPDPEGSIKNTVRGGWGFIRDGSNWGKPVTQERELASLQKLTEKASTAALQSINSFMMTKLNHLYHSSDKSIKIANVVVIRVNTGEFFTSTSSVNGRTPDVHPATDQTVGRVLGLDIHARATDYFSMSFDYQGMPDLLAQWQRAANADVVIPMPDGNARERVRKMANIQNNATDLLGRPLGTQDASFHVFVPNNVQEFHPKLHVITRPLATLLPRGYGNPRVLAMRHNG